MSWEMLILVILIIGDMRKKLKEKEDELRRHKQVRQNRDVGRRSEVDRQRVIAQAAASLREQERRRQVRSLCWSDARIAAMVGFIAYALLFPVVMGFGIRQVGQLVVSNVTRDVVQISPGPGRSSAVSSYKRKIFCGNRLYQNKYEKRPEVKYVPFPCLIHYRYQISLRIDRVVSKSCNRIHGIF